MSSRITPWGRILIQKLTVPQLVKKFLAYYETRGFINVFTRTRHVSLSWPQMNPVNALPNYTIKIRFNIILTYTSRSYTLSLLVSPSKSCMHRSSSPYVPHDRPIISSWFDHPNNIWQKMQIRKILIMQCSPAHQFLPLKSQYSLKHTIGRPTPRLTNRIRS